MYVKPYIVYFNKKPFIKTSILYVEDIFFCYLAEILLKSNVHFNKMPAIY